MPRARNKSQRVEPVADDSSDISNAIVKGTLARKITHVFFGSIQ